MIMGGNVKFISIIVVVRGIGIKLKDEWEKVEEVGYEREQGGGYGRI